MILLTLNSCVIKQGSVLSAEMLINLLLDPAKVLLLILVVTSLVAYREKSLYEKGVTIKRSIKRSMFLFACCAVDT